MAEERLPVPVPRRGFLDLLSKIFLSLWGFGFIGVIYAYLRPQHRQVLLDETFRAGSLSALRVGDAFITQHQSGPVLIVRTGDRDVIAFSALCTHMRCILHWAGDTRTILCPCHGGVFDWNGNVLSGPPPRPLQRYSVEIRNEDIFVRMA
ncbi:MAG: Rieske (2Fe-2S) protein [Acidobacteriota bacterium]